MDASMMEWLESWPRGQEVAAEIELLQEKIVNRDLLIERLMVALQASESLKLGYFDEIERLEAALMKARKFIEYELPATGKTMVAELDAALAGKEGT